MKSILFPVYFRESSQSDDKDKNRGGQSAGKKTQWIRQMDLRLIFFPSFRIPQVIAPQYDLYAPPVSQVRRNSSGIVDFWLILFGFSLFT